MTRSGRCWWWSRCISDEGLDNGDQGTGDGWNGECIRNAMTALGAKYDSLMVLLIGVMEEISIVTASSGVG